MLLFQSVVLVYSTIMYEPTGATLLFANRKFPESYSTLHAFTLLEPHITLLIRREMSLGVEAPLTSSERL